VRMAEPRPRRKGSLRNPQRCFRVPAPRSGQRQRAQEHSQPPTLSVQSSASSVHSPPPTRGWSRIARVRSCKSHPKGGSSRWRELRTWPFPGWTGCVIDPLPQVADVVRRVDARIGYVPDLCEVVVGCLHHEPLAGGVATVPSGWTADLAAEAGHVLGAQWRPDGCLCLSNADAGSGSSGQSCFKFRMAPSFREKRTELPPTSPFSRHSSPSRDMLAPRP
jgi:hypothetical protein